MRHRPGRAAEATAGEVAVVPPLAGTGGLAVVRTPGTRTALTAVAALLACLAVAVLVPAKAAAPVILLVALAIAFRARLAAATGLLALLVLTVMWIPAGRYSLVGVAPALPWRLAVLVLLLVVFLSLTLDPRTRWQRSPFLLLAVALPLSGLASSLANLGSLAELGRVEAGTLANLQVLILVGIVVATRQFVTSSRVADWLCRLLVLAGGVVGLSACYERVSGFNVFLQLQAFLPLQLLSEAPEVSRFGSARALGSANHPIALSVMLALLVPVAVFLARHSPWPRNPVPRRVLYLGAAFVMVLGAFATGSRTFVVALAVMALVLLFANWTVFVRVMFVAAPMGLLAAALSPGTIVGVVTSFFDTDELVQSQYASAGGRGSGRLADLGPSLTAAQDHLVFGTGVGSRIVSGDDVNALILDNQYLSTLLESGLVGLLATGGLLIAPAVVLLRRNRDPRLSEPEQHLALALGCVFAGFAVSAFFFDAFAFQQTLMVFFLLLGVGSWLVATADERSVAVGGRAALRSSV